MITLRTPTSATGLISGDLREHAAVRAEQLSRIGQKARDAAEEYAERGQGRSIWLDDCAARVTISEDYIAGVIADILEHTVVHELQGGCVLYTKPGEIVPEAIGLLR